MEKNEVKKLLYKEKPIATRTQELDQVCFYEAETTKGKITFEVPYREMGETEFSSKEPAQLLIRWIV